MKKSFFSTIPGHRLLKTGLLLAGCLAALHANAQKPEWIPVAELLVGSMGHADPGRMTEVLNRCTALNMTLSGMLAEDSPDMSEGYQNQALKLIQSGILISMNTEKEVSGIEPDINLFSDNAIATVKGLLPNYSAWLSNNYDDNGSYFDNDFEIEMKGCELASKLVSQMTASKSF